MVDMDQQNIAQLMNIGEMTEEQAVRALKVRVLVQLARLCETADPFASLSEMAHTRSSSRRMVLGWTGRS